MDKGIFSRGKCFSRTYPYPFCWFLFKTHRELNVHFVESFELLLFFPCQYESRFSRQEHWTYQQSTQQFAYNIYNLYGQQSIYLSISQKLFRNRDLQNRNYSTFILLIFFLSAKIILNRKELLENKAILFRVILKESPLTCLSIFISSWCLLYNH